MKVYDCFTFFNEFEILELRLKTLWDVVDYFVIVEANIKQSGVPKDFNLLKRADDFKEFFPKIRYIAADLSKVPFKGTGDWSIENAQRNAIMNGIGDAAPDDLIFISDLDEIPAPNIFQRLQGNQIELVAPVVVLAAKNIVCPARLLISAADFLESGAIVMTQKLLCYYFDWINPQTWQGSILTKRKTLTTPQELRNLRNQLPRVLGGGYHFTYMGGADRVIEKMTSVVEGKELVENSSENLLDKKHIEESMAKGTDVYNRPDITNLQFLPYDARNIDLPYFDEFLRKYPHFLREPEKYFI